MAIISQGQRASPAASLITPPMEVAISYLNADYEQVKDTTPRQLELKGCEAEPVIFNTSELLNFAAFRTQRACSYERRGLKREAVKSIDEVMSKLRRAREYLMRDLEE